MKLPNQAAFEAHSPLRWHSWLASQPLQTGEDQPALRGHLGRRHSLADKCLVCFGLGAVGGQSFLDFARLGAGTLIGADPDSYGENSWQTQLATPGDTQRSKAEVLGERAHAINPAIHVWTAVGFAQDMPLRLLHRADVFIAAGDNLELPVWAGNMAAALGKRLFQGAVHGETWTCFVRGYDLRDPDNPCPACALGPNEWQRLSSRYGCDPATMPAQGLEPTRTLPNVCGAAGHLLTGEVLKCLFHAEGQTLGGVELAHCLLSHRVWKTTLRRNPRCRCPHERWQVMELTETPEQLSPRQLLWRLSAKLDRLAVRGECPWFRFARCAECGKQAPARRFARPGTQLGACSCGGALRAVPIAMCSQIPADDLRKAIDTPLSELGLESGDSIGLRDGDGWTYFILGDKEQP